MAVPQEPSYWIRLEQAKISEMPLIETIGIFESPPIINSRFPRPKIIHLCLRERDSRFIRVAHLSPIPKNYISVIYGVWGRAQPASQGVFLHTHSSPAFNRISRSLPRITDCNSVGWKLGANGAFDLNGLDQRYIGSQLPSGSLLGISDQLVGSTPEPKGENSDQYFRGFIPPPVPIRRLMLLLVCVWLGWWLTGRGREQLNYKRYLIGSALIGLGVLLWLGVLIIWFISRYPWAWGLPI